MNDDDRIDAEPPVRWRKLTRLAEWPAKRVLAGRWSRDERLKAGGPHERVDQLMGIGPDPYLIAPLSELPERLESVGPLFKLFDALVGDFARTREPPPLLPSEGAPGWTAAPVWGFPTALKAARPEVERWADGWRSRLPDAADCLRSGLDRWCEAVAAADPAAEECRRRFRADLAAAARIADVCVCRIVGLPLRAWADGPDAGAGFGTAILEPLLIGERQFVRPPGWSGASGNRTAAASPDAGDAWPPSPDEWFFRPGEAAFGGVTFDVCGRHRRLLERLGTAGRRLTKDDLADAAKADPRHNAAVWSAVRGYLTELRRTLRVAFALAAGTDPIPAKGTGTEATWAVDDDLLRGAAEKQREH